MSEKDNNYYLEREKRYNWEQSQAELEHLLNKLNEVRSQFGEEGLAEEERQDLVEQLTRTLTAIAIIRRSLQALADPSAIMIEDTTKPITFEITDKKAYWSDEYRIKCQELDDLLAEYQSYAGKVLTEDESISLRKLEVDLGLVETEAEQALENFKRIQN